jgi:hypothetical protein
LLAHGRWFSPGTPASSTTKTGRHDIAEILLEVVLNIKNQIIKAKITKPYKVHGYYLGHSRTSTCALECRRVGLFELSYKNVF